MTTDNPHLARLAQTALSSMGLYPGAIDGVWGPKSQAAFAAYEAKMQPTPAQVSTEDPEWLKIARKELGTAEIEGARDNARIVEYHQATSLKATEDETPWCASFVNWALNKAVIAGTGSAMARSFLHWGRALVAPRLGCIVVFARGKYPQGRVAFYLGREGNSIKVLGGNQGNRVSIANYPAAQVLGYRWPA